MNQHASINRAYRLIWNQARCAWVPVAETMRAYGKRTTRAALWLAPLLAAVGVVNPAYAVGAPPAPTQLPTGGRVVAGSATLSSGGSGSAVLDVNQTSSRAVIDWNSFNVGSAAEVDFNQPNSSSATLNRVLGSDPSEIFGKITAPGQVFLANPEGIYFGKSASVNVGGLTATTGSISNADFMAGKIKFNRDGATGRVINDGTLKASLGGYIALLAPDVRNDGVIVAKMGTVVMAAGDAITLNFNDGHLTGITATPAKIKALVENRSAVFAPGGLIILSAKAVNALEGGVVENSGTLAATGMVSRGGRIVLEASSRIANTGTITANAGADGGPAGGVSLSAPSVDNGGDISAAADGVSGAHDPQGVRAGGGTLEVSANTIQQSASGLLDVSGATAGSVQLQAVKGVDLSGSILAVGKELATSTTASPNSGIGGALTVTSSGTVTLQNVQIDVSGEEAAGSITIQGGEPAPSAPRSPNPAVDVLGASELDASSRHGKGGSVSLTGSQVNLLGNSAIHTQGANGGGDVYIGGGLRGADPSLADATETTVGGGVSIDASALQNGNAGDVVVWSSQHTAFAGTILARGGSEGGSGGTLEVSGAQLDFTGAVNAGAPKGPGGSLLLDPQNITVTAGGTDSVANESFATNPSSSSTIDPSTITAITDTGTGVTLQANNDITISSSIETSDSSGAGGTLTFTAGRSIAINASVISDNGNISFNLNDSGATAADRGSGAATFTNTSEINAGTGNVSITMGTLGASGNITTGHITAANLSVIDNGTTSGTTLDLNETDLTGTLDISAAAANPNLTNSVGTVAVHGAATIDVGTGNVTLNTNPNTEFTTLGLTAGTVQLVNSNAIQFANVDVASLTETTQGPIAQTSGSTMTVAGAADLTADYGGFGYADPYIRLMNSGNHFGTMALDVPSTGSSGSGGYVQIADSGAADITSATTASSFSLTATDAIQTGTITAGGSGVHLDSSTSGVTAGSTTASTLNISADGAVSLGATKVTDLTTLTTGAISNTGAVTVSRQTDLSAGAANNITLDNAGNSFDYVRIESGDNVTLADQGALEFGNFQSAGGWTSHISGNLSVTAGGNISQVGDTYYNGYSAIEVDGTTTFIANNATSQINLSLGSTNPQNNARWLGQANDFVGTVTLEAENSNTGFSQVDIRNTNSGAAVLSGLTSVGTLQDVWLTYDNAPSVSIPGMTVTGTLEVYAPGVQNTSSTPTNIISQTGPLSIGGNAIFTTSSSGDVVLTNAKNDFNDVVFTSADNVSVTDSNSIILNAIGYDTICGNLQINADGTISDQIGTNQGIQVNGASTWAPGAGNDVDLTARGTNGLNLLGTVNVPTANNVTIDPIYSVSLGNMTVGGTLTVSSYQGNGWSESLSQASGTTIDVTGNGVTTLANFRNGITLNQPDNVFGPLAISNSGTLNIQENAPITQASAWSDASDITLTTTNEQGIDLSEAANDLGPLVLTQENHGATSAGAVTVVDADNSAQGLTQAGAWALSGTTALDSGSHSIDLNNPNNVLGPLQVTSSAGTTGSSTTAPSSITIYAKNTASADAITDVGGTGPWTTGTSEVVNLVGYDATGATEGGGNINLSNPGNVLGALYIKGNNVTITENSNIIDGPILTNWDGTGDNGWATTGSMHLVVANPSGKTIDLSNLDNQIGPIALSTTGTAGTLSSVLITDNQDLTQNGAWEVGSAPVTLDARTHAVSLTNSSNVMGNISIETANGTASSVAITEDDAITQGSAWDLTGVPVTLVAENGNSITLTKSSNIMGNMTVTAGSASVTENGNITQGGAWSTTGTTTLDPTTGAIALTNSSNVLGPIAIGGTPSAVSITENADVTQAAPWSDASTPFALNSESHDILLSQASNELGKLTLTGANATVTENSTAGISEGAAWDIPGTTTLTAGSTNPIVLDVTPANSLGTVSVVSASTADVATAGGVVIGESTVSTGPMTINAAGPITQSGAITSPELLLIGTGEATLNNTANDVGTLAAGFSGGDLAFTNSGSFAVGVIDGTTGITIGDHNVSLASVNGTVTGLTDVNASSSSLTVNAGAGLSLPQLAISGAQTYTAASGITLTAGLTSTAAGPITFNSPVTLAADLTVQSDNSSITFAGSLAGANYQLQVNAGTGLVQFDGAVSSLGRTTDASAGLTLSSGGADFKSTLNANNGLAVTGPVTFNDTVTLADGSAASVFTGLVTLGKSGGMSLSGYNGMSFDGGVLLQNGPATIDSNNSPLTFQTAGKVSGPYGLTLDSGTASITGLDRMGSDLTSLDVTALNPTIPTSGISIAGPQSYTATSGSNITLDGNVTGTASGAISLDGPVVLGAAVTVTSENSNVNFGGTVNGNKNLTVDSGSGVVGVTGAVGAVTPVGSGTGASLVLNGTGEMIFGSNVNARSGITAAGPVVFNGNVMLGDGDTASVFSGTVTAGSKLGSTLNGYKGMAFNGGLTLSGGPVTVDSNGGTIAFGGAVSGAENLKLDALSNGAGTVTGLDQIGPKSDLTGLDVTAQTLNLPSGGLAVAGPMTFTAPGGLTLNGAVGSATSPASGAITFNGPMTLATGPVTVTTADAPVLFNGSLNGAELLTVDAGTGTTTFALDVGNTIPLSGVQTGVGGTTVLDAGEIATSGAQFYGGDVTVGADTVLSGNDVHFMGTVGGAHALVVNDSGTTTFDGPVDTLTSLDVTAAKGIVEDGSAITTTGSQTYDGAVTLGADETFTGSGVEFGSTVDGAHILTVNSGSGALKFDAALGASTPLTSLSATGEHVSAGNVSTTAAQSYTGIAGVSLGGVIDTAGGAVTVSGPTTLTADTSIGTSGGNIDFSGSTSTIDGDHSLKLEGGSGSVLLGGVVGGSNALSAFTDSGYNLTLPDVTTVGDANQSYTALNDITLTQSRTLDAPVSFTADSDGNGSGSFILQNGVSLTASNNSLAITAADLQLQGNSTLSSGTGLMSITATDGRNIYLGGSTTAAGQMTITASELSRMSTSGGLALKTSGSGWIDVNGITAQDSQNITGTLDLEAQGTGAISFISAPSTFTALRTDATGGATNVGVNVTTAGHDAEFVTSVTVSGASTIASGGGNIKFDDGVSVANDLTVVTNNGSLTFGGPVGSTSTLTLNLGGGSVSGLSKLQGSLTGLTVNGSAAISLPAIDINGPQVYNTGAITLTGNLTGTGIALNSVLTAAPVSGTSLVLNAGTGTLTFGGIADFNGTDMTLIADNMEFSQPVAGTGSLTIEPYRASDNIAIGGSGSPISGLNITASDLGDLPLADLASLAVGGASDTGAINIVGPLNAASTPLTLNGGGGITQSGGAIASGALTLEARGNAIDLPNTSNAVGAVAIDGTPTALTLANSKNITQQGYTGWVLGNAPITMNAGSADINLGNSGNTFGTLELTGGNATVNESVGSDLGASILTGNLAVTSSGGIDVSGALSVQGNVALNAGGEITQSAPLSIGGNLDAATSVNAGDVSIDNSGSKATILGNSEVGGNYAITATGEPVTQAAGSAVQVAGNLTVTAGSVDLSGAANLVGGSTSLPSSNTTVIERPGVINLSSGTYSGNLTVISQSTSRSLASAEVNGNAIVLDNSSNNVGGTISVSASPPTITTGADVQTGITQNAGTSLNVSGIATFTAENSSAGSVGVDLSNSGNDFGTLQVTGTTVTVDNAAATLTTLENSEATKSLSITSAGGVDQNGAINTPALTIYANGAITLENSRNTIGNLTATSGGGDVGVADAVNLNIGGINAGGGDVSLSAVGVPSAAGTGDISEGGAITNAASLTLNATGGVTLNSTANTIGALNASTAEAGFDLYDSNGLNVDGAVKSDSGNMVVRATGNVTLEKGGSLDANAGDLAVSTEGSGNFINDSSLAGSALSVGSGDRWLVYSDTPNLVSGPRTVKGGLASNFRTYAETYATDSPASVTQSGNGFIYDYATPTLVVEAVVSGSSTQVYGDTPSGKITYKIASGLVDSEDNVSNVITGGTATYNMLLSNNLNAGAYAVKYTGGLTSSNYTLTADTAGSTYTVTPATLKYVASSASRKYGAANPVLSGMVTGFKLGQSASQVLSGTPTWTTTATSMSAVGSYGVTGSGYTTNGNYILEQATGNATALSVTQAPLTVTATNDTVTYNGTGFSGGAGVTYSGFVNGEGASALGGTLAYGGSAQGARDAGTYAISPSGLKSENYAISYVVGKLTINKANLDVTTSNVTKTYDGTVAANGAPIVTDGTKLFGTDSLSGGSCAFTNANAGDGDKTVTVSGVSVNDGNGGGNYNVTYVDNTTSTIKPAGITVSTGNVTKTYDGTDSASGSPTVISGTLYDNSSNGGIEDSLSGGTFAFSNPNAGSATKTVSVSGVTVNDGNGGKNYDVTYANNTTSTITPAALTFSGTIATKTYDGTTVGSLSGYTLKGLVGNQTLVVGADGVNFSDPNAGSGKTVTVSGISLKNGKNGGLASNYTVSNTSTATGTIDPKMLTVDASVANKVYDGTTAAVVENYGLSGFVGNQTVNAVYTGSANFDNKNVGSGKPVSITGIELVNGANGGLASNYEVPATVTARANVTPAALHIVGVVAENKVYDGTATADLNTQSALLTGVIGADSVGVSKLTGTFASKNVGNNISIGTGTVVLSGPDAGNYILVQPSGLTADITPRPLTVTATGVNKVYDGGTGASVVFTDNVLPGDSVSISSDNAFLDPNVGQNKYIAVSNILLSGPQAQDYVSNSNASAYANITPATLIVTATGESKPYDGTDAARVTLSANTVSGDQVTLADSSAMFDNANPGNNKPVTVEGIYISGGADASNYVLGNTSATTTADITGQAPSPTPPTRVPSPRPTPASGMSTGQVLSEAVLPPAIPTPQPPVTPSPQKTVLDIALPADFGAIGDSVSSGTSGSSSAVGDASHGPSVGGGGSATGLSESVPGTAGGSGGSRASSGLVGVAHGDRVSGGTAQHLAIASTSAEQESVGVNVSGHVNTSTGINVSGGNLGEQSATTAARRGFSGASQLGASQISISLVKSAKGSQKGLIVVSVPGRLIEAREVIQMPLPAAVAREIGRVPVTVSGVRGGKLPTWLSYDSGARTFMATRVRSGVLPYKALVRAGSKVWIVIITEQAGS